MGLFLGTFLIVLASCGLLAWVSVAGKRPIKGGCGRDPASGASCEVCPRRRRGECAHEEESP